jgi:hypothetical protein
VTTSSAILSSAARPRNQLKDAKDKSGSVSWTKMFLFVAACGLGYYGWKQYTLRNRRRPGYGGGGVFGGLGGGSGGFYSSSKSF